ncbi:hypothetical protein KAT51_02490 [bacterium]|nr:hypothetical protein [bacterium]
MNSDTCGSHPISYTYLATGVSTGDKVTVTDEGDDVSKKYKNGYYIKPEDLGADVSFVVKIPKVYLVSRKEGEAIPTTNIYSQKEKVYPAHTPIELFSIWRLKVTDEEKGEMVSRYYLGPTTTASPPQKAQIYAHQVTLLPWEWDELNIEWKEIELLDKEEEEEVEGTKELPLAWTGWDHSQTFEEGPKRYQVGINASGGGDTISSKGVHRIRMSEEEGKEEGEE